MKIVVYSGARAFGGHELIGLKGVAAILAQGLDVVFFCPSANIRLIEAIKKLEADYPGNLKVELLATGAKSMQILRTWLNIRQLYELSKALRRHRPDKVLLLQGDIEQGSEMILAAALAKIPSVSYIPMILSGAERGIRFARFRDVLSRPLYKLCDRFIVISSYFDKRAKALGAKDVLTVTNCVDNSFFDEQSERELKRQYLGIGDAEVVSGFFGRIAYYQKGIDRLVELVEQNKSHFEKNRLLIIGDGPDSELLRTEILNKGLERQIIFLTWQDKRVPYFDVLDVFLCTSRFEGVPLVILEAMVRSVPVVSVELPSIVEDLPLTFQRGAWHSSVFFEHVKNFGMRKPGDFQSNVEIFRQAHFERSFFTAVVA